MVIEQQFSAVEHHFRQFEHIHVGADLQHWSARLQHRDQLQCSVQRGHAGWMQADVIRCTLIDRASAGSRGGVRIRRPLG